MAQITKDQIADVLESIAQLLELKGENPFKVRAYTNAARALESFAGKLDATMTASALAEIPGIGKAIAEKITELVTTGELAYFNELRKEFPDTLFELFELQGLGPKKIKAVWEQLGVTSIAQLADAVKEGRVAGLAGFGKKTAENILAAIVAREKHAGRFRLGDIAADAEHLLGDLRKHPAVIRVNVCGSYRRRKEIVGDLDFLVSTNAPAEVSEFFVGHDMVESVMAKGATKSSVRLKSSIQADLRVVKEAEFPFALNYFTGSKEHNIIMRQRALARGWTLNEYRLAPLANPKIEIRNPKSEPPAIREEAELYRALGLDYVEPELREDRGEFAAAENHTLPDLVAPENLRGTFHNHTTASDGRCTLAEMVEGAQELGLQYLGIADHSKSSFQAHGLDAKQLLAQVAEIRELNKTFGKSFRLFAGSEVDIMKDGSLDFPDDVLAQLDYAVASVHSVFNLSEAEMTKRIIRAIENPHITMLGHLTGRLLLSREGYRVDAPAIIEAAAATGTIIELNANPRRLDMDWRWWPLAKEKGVKCAINPDAHHTSHLQFLWFGIGTARKGWLTKGDVVNTLPLGKIEAVLAAKRGR
ncbi:MAG TPA: DNA polymerase/3'-5' exonuclease PolX [Chthoniobacteraceae bacterium]|nr:DNA polymerase/3'-5' exonuclease PolX [Chthoniobacteraceae bacterium]